MKEVYCFQEVETEIRTGEAVTFTIHPTVHVTAVRKNLDSQAITITLEIMIGEYAIGEYTQEFSSIQLLLEAFDIADHVEIFEMVGEP